MQIAFFFSKNGWFSADSCSESRQRRATAEKTQRFTSNESLSVSPSLCLLTLTLSSCAAAVEGCQQDTVSCLTCFNSWLMLWVGEGGWGGGGGAGINFANLATAKSKMSLKSLSFPSNPHFSAVPLGVSCPLFLTCYFWLTALSFVLSPLL